MVGVIKGEERKMISIVTGTLNRKNYLEELIKNTVDSNNKLELILVDGGSSDGTIETIENINHPRIKLIKVGKRSSYPHFMNLGIENSSYEIVCQWNDDVLLMNDWEDVLNEIDEHDFYLFNWKMGSINDFHEKSGSWIDGTNQCDGWCLTNTKNNSEGVIVMNYGLYKKNIFREIGMYDKKFVYYYADADMAERAWRFNFKCKNLPHIKVLSLHTEKRANHNSQDEIKFQENKKMYINRTIPKTIDFLK